MAATEPEAAFDARLAICPIAVVRGTPRIVVGVFLSAMIQLAFWDKNAGLLATKVAGEREITDRSRSKFKNILLRVLTTAKMVGHNHHIDAIAMINSRIRSASQVQVWADLQQDAVNRPLPDRGNAK